MNKVDTLATMLEARAARLDALQDHYFIGQNPNGSYYGVLGQDVKTRQSAAQLRTAQPFIDKGITPIKIMKRKAKA